MWWEVGRRNVAYHFFTEVAMLATWVVLGKRLRPAWLMRRAQHVYQAVDDNCYISFFESALESAARPCSVLQSSC